MNPAIINTYTDTLHTDYKAEVIAAEMIENGTPIDRLLILMLGGNRRSYRKDVDEITEDISEYDHKEYIHIKTNKEGIYDMLPEGIFHYPTLPKSATTETEIVKAIKRHKQEEKNARQFFLPFEAAINDQRIQLALNENLLDKRLHNSKLVDIFSSQWEIFNWLDARQSNVFLHLLPLIHDLRDDYEVAAIIFELILQLPIQINQQLQAAINCDQPYYTTLDDCLLGIDFTTGNEMFFTGEDELIVTVGPMDNEMLQTFMHAGKNAKILELLCDHFLPVHLDINIELKLATDDKMTRLADGIHDYNCTLGACTYL